MVGYIDGVIDGFADITGTIAANEAETKAGAIPGVIVSFNAATQTADIQPQLSYVTSGAELPAPVLYDVPVRFPRLGGAYITIPVNAGDTVTLRPMMRSMEPYHAGGNAGGADARYNSFSDMEAYIDGSYRIGAPISDFDNENVTIRNGSTYIKLSASGKLEINTAAGSLFDIMEKTLQYLKEQNDGGSYESKYNTELERIQAVRL